MKRVVVVDDSDVVRQYLTYIFNSDPYFRVVGEAANGERAIDLAERLRPDVITMDVKMPRMNGYEATRRIMETVPTPIIMITASWNPDDVEKAFLAMDAGALCVLEKPPGLGSFQAEAAIAELVRTVKLMAEVPVVRRWPRKADPEPVAPSEVIATPRASSKFSVVAVGASTGGPPALRSLLSHFSPESSVPVLVVQHIAVGFLQGLANWLAHDTGWPVTIATHGERALPGQVYLAPDGLQMGLGEDGRVALAQAPAEFGHCPSVAYLFRSIASEFGDRAVGVLLSGMGKDGSAELGLIQDRGGITLTQDEETSVIYGMPGEAKRLGASQKALPPDQIGEILSGLVNTKDKEQTDVRPSHTH